MLADISRVGLEPGVLVPAGSCAWLKRAQVLKEVSSEKLVRLFTSCVDL